MKRPFRIIPIPRKEPDLKLLAQALIALVDEQRQRGEQEDQPGTEPDRKRKQQKEQTP